MRLVGFNEAAVGTKAAAGCAGISRAGVAGRATGGCGWWRKGTLRIVAALALLLSTSPLLAESMHASGDQAVKSRAGLDFRIVIPETLHIDSQAQRRAKSQPFISRTTQAEAGRMVVTVAKP